MIENLVRPLAGLSAVFDATWAHAAMVLALFGVLVVVGVFTYLDRYTRKGYFRLWTVAWVFYALWLMFSLGAEESFDLPSYVMARRACIGIGAICMLWGSFDLVGIVRGRGELWAAVGMILVWSYVAAFQVQDSFWITLPVFSLLSVVSCYTGWMYFRTQRQYRGARMLGWGFMLWGVHLWGFGMQAMLPASLLVPGYIGSGVVALFIALGMIVLVLEEARDRHEVVMDEFRKGLANRRQLEEEISVSEERYRALFNAASDAILLVDGESLEVLERNEKAVGWFGTVNAGGKARTLMDLFPEVCPSGVEVGECLGRVEKLLSSSREFSVRRANGVSVLCEGNVSRVEVNRRGVLQITLHEVTERKKLEQQLRQSEKLSALGQLVAGVAHELNNPLAVIMGYAQILVAQGCPPARVRGDLAKILHESERAAKIVRNLLTFARPREPQMAPVDLNAIVSGITAKQEAEMESAAIQLRARLLPGLPKTMADAHQMEQVLTNLVSNAVQALSQHSGRRVLEVATEQQERVVRVSVADSGPGIPSDIVPKIFDPFFTTKSPGKGTGLGLSICYSIIQEHRGRIWVETEPGKGAKFIIEIPLVRCEGGTRTEEPSGLPSRGEAISESKKHRVLVVDDEPGIVDVLRALIEESGCAVETANNGAVALELIRQTGYDLIISDLCMPDLGGEALYRAVREFSPMLSRRIIFITGDTVSGGAREFLESTGNRWFGKPFNLGEMEKAICAFLSEEPATVPVTIRA